MLQAGYSGTHSAKALSWAKWGKKYDKPAYGSVAVVKYDEDRGHVGFVVGKDSKNRLIILGGNQGKKGEGSVNYKAFGTSKIIAYTLPEDYSFIEYDLPTIDEEMEEGTFESTR
jgi:flagellar protein FlgJ